ncbi:FapA family protein [Herbaspirillum lusitanum]|uniref:FapA family protein n=1 Tax=Herbaspirillum lusitanum TaxID=213312 RepID=A0ABW9A6K0_9BURK
MEQATPQTLSFGFDRASGELSATYTPREGFPALTLAFLKQALTDNGLTKLHIEESVLNAFVRKAEDAKEPVSQVIGQRRDGEFSLEVADDLMTASLTLVAPRGGRAKSVEVINAIRAAGITHGILHEQLRGALSAGQCNKLVIAQGDMPSVPEPARFESLLEEKKEELSEIDEDAVVSYADMGYLLLVSAGDPLMRRTPPVQGKEGMDIKGKPVPAKPIADIGFAKESTGAEPSEEDPDLLVATVAGQPTVIKNGVKVNPIIDIENVDLSTGNLDFEGTVRVSGDVKTGMRLHVSGDVIVSGTVEAAEIVAGGNVTVKGGVIGHSEGASTAQAGTTSIASRIKSQGSVQVQFAESAHIEAAESILVIGNARQCELLAGNEIIVGKGNPRVGQIIGGRIQATQLIKANGIGSANGNLTKVQVGLDPYLEEKLELKDQEYKRKLAELDRTIKQISYYKLNPQKATPQVLEETHDKRKALAQEVKIILEEYNEMKEELISAEQARIVIAKAVYEGVEMRIGSQVWQVPSEMSGGTAQLIGGHIEYARKK